MTTTTSTCSSVDADSEPRYWVYLSVLGNACPQLWMSDLTTGVGGFRHKPVGEDDSDLLYFRRLEGADRALSFEQLKDKYPFVPGFVYTGVK